MSTPLRLRLLHLFPRHMNLHGDVGNLITLVARLRARGFDAEIIPVNPGDRPCIEEADLLFLGGGQDRGQRQVAPHLQLLGDDIRASVSSGTPALVVHGGFQLFARHLRTADGEELPGISVFDAYTTTGAQRCVGNAVVDAKDLFATWGGAPYADSSSDSAEVGGSDRPTTLVGFENHNGLTHLGGSTRALGPLLTGYGNLGDGSAEGAVVHNAVGTYLHGPILPKNPHLADHLLLTALRRRYGPEVKLIPLDDTVEWQAHHAAVERALTTKTTRLLRK